MIHNRYLPTSLHRLANGAAATFAALGIGSLLWARFEPGGAISAIGKALAILSAPLGIVVAWINPRLLSLVEGIAGDAGRDELDTPSRKQSGAGEVQE